MQEKNIKIYDSIVIGAGPAGLTSAMYLLRADKKVLIIEKEAVGGGISSTPLIENYPGFIKISGEELADNLFEQVTNFGGELEVGEVKNIEKYNGDLNNNLFKISTDGPDFYAKAVIIATGTKYRKLNLPNEENLIGHGISFCVTCDGAFYKNQTVAVVGGGNTAVTTALKLADICKEVIVIQNLPELTAEKVLVNKLKEKNNVRVISNAKVTQLIGDTELEEIKISHDNVEENIKIEGMFESIGRLPETEFLKGVISLNSNNFIDSKENCNTNMEGVFVAGDVRNKAYRQITTSTADGTVAALEAIKYLSDK